MPVQQRKPRALQRLPVPALHHGHPRVRHVCHRQRLVRRATLSRYSCVCVGLCTLGVILGRMFKTLASPFRAAVQNFIDLSVSNLKLVWCRSSLLHGIPCVLVILNRPLRVCCAARKYRMGSRSYAGSVSRPNKGSTGGRLWLFARFDQYIHVCVRV